MSITIRYRVHDQKYNTKTETVIRSDGNITIKFYEQDLEKHHYHLKDKNTYVVPTKSVSDLYQVLLRMISNHIEVVEPLIDLDAEVIMEKEGLKISIDAGLTNGNQTCKQILDEFLSKGTSTYEN